MVGALRELEGLEAQGREAFMGKLAKTC